MADEIPDATREETSDILSSLIWQFRWQDCDWNWNEDEHPVQTTWCPLRQFCFVPAVMGMQADVVRHPNSDVSVASLEFAGRLYSSPTAMRLVWRIGSDIAYRNWELLESISNPADKDEIDLVAEKIKSQIRQVDSRQSEVIGARLEREQLLLEIEPAYLPPPRPDDSLCTTSGQEFPRDEFSEECRSPSEWGRIFECNPDTFRNWADPMGPGQMLRIVKEKRGSYRVHRDDLPEGFKTKRSRDRKLNES